MRSPPLTPCLVLIVLGLLPGCVLPWREARQHQSSSVVQFLYPGKDHPFVQPAIPTLRLPLHVGVAFVPPAEPRYGYYGSDFSLPEAAKADLMRQIVAKFKTLPFVQDIQVVPTSYLRPGGSFENLDQLRAMLGVDVVVLLAYDQAQLTNDTSWALTYWTLIGAYVVPGQKNDTHTLMEAVVYDIASRKLLFRAPGVSSVAGHSTPIRTTDQLRADSAEGFAKAAQDLTANLHSELTSFQARLKEAPDEVHIERKPGYTGAGAVGPWLAIGTVLLLGGGVIRGRRFREQPPPAAA